MVLREYAERYRRNLLESVIPFWMKHSIDQEFGGYFTCLDRDGSVFDTRKYVWLQGRQVWMLSKMYNEIDRRRDWIEAAKNGVDFLRNHVRDAQGRCYFSLTREGAPSFYQRKPYGAVFVMLGYLEYSKAASDKSCREEALELFDQIEQWIAQPALLGRPELQGAPQAAQLADVYVIASMALELFRATGDDRWRVPMRTCQENVLPHFDPETGLLMEMAGPDLRRYPEGRLVCAGSVFEIAWFLFRILEVEPNDVLRARLLRAVQAALEFSWDQEYSGFYYFQDIEGKPTLQLEASMKLWWVHAEALCCLVHCYALTGDSMWLRWLERVDRYVFDRFVDPEYGEWFGYLHRDGAPALTLKGNNYKGCFHVPRALLLSFLKIEQIEGTKIR